MTPPSDNPLSPAMRRMLDAAAEMQDAPTEREIAYHHTVFCQTALPYRQVEGRVVERTNGDISLSIEAGRARHPQTQHWVDLPLPFGTQSRLIMIYLDTFAVERRTPMVDVEHSMTAFLKKLRGYSPNGRELAAFRTHAAAVTGALFRIAGTRHDRTFQIDTKIVTSYELWFPNDPDQHQLWPTFMRLSDEYYNTLIRHAVPLDHRAVAGLQHNALALDIYKWLAQRLCRVSSTKPAFIPWPQIHNQFGQPYTRIRAFRGIFLTTLKLVCSQYPAAKISADQRGLVLHQSSPPVTQRPIVVNPSSIMNSSDTSTK